MSRLIFRAHLNEYMIDSALATVSRGLYYIRENLNIYQHSWNNFLVNYLSEESLGAPQISYISHSWIYPLYCHIDCELVTRILSL